ncbi:MAG TPA: multiheme c-type cytochrome, partial [Terracidiphilus sp.]|nr:multiheme c-type cytochrome [Terracidiphilus sp.]
MTRRLPLLIVASAALLLPALHSAAQQPDPASAFRTSERCMNCHSVLKTSSGKDASIGFEWSASIMANAAHDPYWLGSVRREVLDHPQASAAIQNECATCHMPLQYLQNKAQGHDTGVFSNTHVAAAAEGVTCTVCHQIQP